LQPSCSEEISPGDLFHASRPGLAFLPEPVPVAMKGVINVSTTAKDEPVGEISDTAAQGLLDGNPRAGVMSEDADVRHRSGFALSVKSPAAVDLAEWESRRYTAYS
jgi:hypothetical protein